MRGAMILGRRGAAERQCAPEHVCWWYSRQLRRRRGQRQRAAPVRGRPKELQSLCDFRRGLPAARAHAQQPPRLIGLPSRRAGQRGYAAPQPVCGRGGTMRGAARAKKPLQGHWAPATRRRATYEPAGLSSTTCSATHTMELSVPRGSIIHGMQGRHVTAQQHAT